LGPIHWSSVDTAETAHQVHGHNAAWTALCGKEGRS
jgi:hypothetical protein